MMEFPTMATVGRRFVLAAVAVGTLAALAPLVSTPVGAQSSIYVDGNTPVDPRTRARVDAYFDELENRRQAKAEERERFQRFIYQDNIFGLQQNGRF